MFCLFLLLLFFFLRTIKLLCWEIFSYTYFAFCAFPPRIQIIRNDTENVLSVSLLSYSGQAFTPYLAKREIETANFANYPTARRFEVYLA